MCSRFTALLILFLAATLRLSGQGLVSVQNYSADFKNEEPLSFYIRGQSGYDSLRYRMPTPTTGDIHSWYVQGGIGTSFTRPDQTTPMSFSLDTSAIRYLNGSTSFGDKFYNAAVRFSIEHRASERLKFGNNLYATYGIDPSAAFMYGASTALWSGQYFYGFNNFNVSYAWSPRFSTTTSYTIDGIFYDDSTLSNQEDRYSHLFSQQFAYALTKRTNLILEYRYRMTNYVTSAQKNFQSHFALAGVDHAWSERFSGSARAGAEFYQSDTFNKTSPYAETALNYAVDRKTSIKWFSSLGYNGAQLASFNSRYAFTTSLQANHFFTKAFNGTAGVIYSHSLLHGTPSNINQDAVLMNVGLGYQMSDHFNVNANYSYSILRSTLSANDYDRHRVSLGATATF